MQITIGNKQFSLNVKAALANGTLREQKKVALELTENEAATLRFVLGKVGGSPSGIRGYIDPIFRKLDCLDLECDKKLDVDTKMAIPNCIFLVDNQRSV